MVRDLGRKIEEASSKRRRSRRQARRSKRHGRSEPLPVEIQEPAPTPMQIIRTVIGPLISPLATAGIVIVFVIFMLLKREDLRDRLIRLAGSRDLPRTTQALDDAARRVGRYLLMQLVVNTTYAHPDRHRALADRHAEPDPLGHALRRCCASFPISGRSSPPSSRWRWRSRSIRAGRRSCWPARWFIVVELISNNVVEPWLYGASTGLSPIAIIAAAVFWTWLWGPIGLLLSTPLTVCLVVLGRHVPQLAFLDVLLGNEPVLEPPELLYQRLWSATRTRRPSAPRNIFAEALARGFYDDVADPGAGARRSRTASTADFRTSSASASPTARWC